jgi:hypothetical protein
MALNEDRLRMRIRHTFYLNDPKLPQDSVREVENEVLAFIRTYAQAPEWQKDAVYAREEERLLALLNAARGGYDMNRRLSSRK